MAFVTCSVSIQSEYIGNNLAMTLFVSVDAHFLFCSRNVPVIPAATKWSQHHQLDEGEFTCSASQARNRWPAEAIFGRVLNAPALQGTIPFHFLHFVEQAHAVAYLNVLTCDFNVEPEGWSSSRAHLDRMHGSGSHSDLSDLV